jgi:hypothetical protein
VWLLAANAANRGVVASMPGFAISDSTWVIFCVVWFGADSTGVVVCGTALRGVTIQLAFVASGRGAERNVFGDIALTVEHRELSRTKRLLCHFPNKSKDHRGSLFTLTTVRAGEPSWRLTHMEGQVGIVDFRTNFF